MFQTGQIAGVYKYLLQVGNDVVLSFASNSGTWGVGLFVINSSCAPRLATHRDPCLRHKRNTDVAKLPCALMAINVLRSRYYATMGKCRSGLAAIPLRSPIAVSDQGSGQR